jgi:hypothetical protein
MYINISLFKVFSPKSSFSEKEPKTKAPALSFGHIACLSAVNLYQLRKNYGNKKFSAPSRL